MNRRELIKSIGALTALSCIPLNLIGGLSERRNFHFIGLGSGGTNVVRRLQQKGIVGNYSCITWFPSVVKPIPFDPNPFEPYKFVPYEEINHIDYEYPPEFRKCNNMGTQRILLTDQMKSTLSQDCIYFVFVGLGAFTGTSLITDVIEFLEGKRTNYLAICSLPFKNEGKWRNDYANLKMKELTNFKNVRFFDNEIIRTTYNENSIARSFELANEEMIRIFNKEIYN